MYDVFFNCNKYVTLVGDVDHGEANHVWGQGLYRKSLDLFINFPINLNLLLKLQC